MQSEALLRALWAKPAWVSVSRSESASEWRLAWTLAAAYALQPAAGRRSWRSAGPLLGLRLTVSSRGSPGRGRRARLPGFRWSMPMLDRDGAVRPRALSQTTAAAEVAASA